MAQAGNDADDLAVSLTWAGEAAVVADPIHPPPPPPPGARRPPPPATQGPQARPSPPAPKPAPAARPQQQPRRRPDRPDPQAFAPAARSASPRSAPPDPRAGRPAPSRPSRADDDQWAGPPPRQARPTAEPSSVTLVSILEHLTTLSRLVTGTSRATSAELDSLGARVEKVVGDLDALQLRVLRSLAGFDALRLRVQKELADRPPLTDEDIARIADAVTARLLDSVRVETEADR